MLDIIPKIVNIDKKEVIHISAIAGDTERAVNFRFISNSKIISLKDCYVRVYAINSRYNEALNTLKIIDADKGIAQMELTPVLLQEGVTRYQLMIQPVGGGTLSSNIMELHVDKPLIDGFDPTNTNEYQAFMLGLKILDGYDKRVKDLENAENTYIKKVVGTRDNSYRLDKDLEVGDDNKQACMGVGSEDVFLYNSSSKKYFQMKDDGTLTYDNVEILRQAPSKPLWIGYHHMVEDETVNLGKNISETNNGILLVWSHFTDGSSNGDNWDVSYSFIPKNSPLLNSKHTFAISSGELDNSLCSKTIYVIDGNKISGHDNNRKGNSESVVLRAILEI